MTTLDTQALRALEAKATPAPWRADCSSLHDADRFLARFTARPLEDAEFIAKLRNAAPALLDAAEENEKYRTAANVLCAAHIGLPQASCPVCERDALRAELSWIDSVLARRPALDKPTRAANIEHAINVAKQADALKAEVAKLQLSASDVEFHGNEQIKALRSEVERLREALRTVDTELELYEYVEEGFLRSCVRAALRPTEREVKP